MSIENDVAEGIVDLVMRKIPSLGSTKLDSTYYFLDTVERFDQGSVTLRTGYRGNRHATVLNKGLFQAGDNILIIRTADNALWGFFPFGGARKPKVPFLKNRYILTFIDDSGSMGQDIPAIEEMLATWRAAISEQVYGGNEADIAKYFMPTLYPSDERFVAWMAQHPIDGGGNLLTEEYSVLTLSFINESSGIYAPTDWAGEPMTEAFEEDVGYLEDASKIRKSQDHLVFNVLRYPEWTYGDFLVEVKQYLDDYGYVPSDVPPDQDAAYYLDLVKEILGL